MRRSERTPLAGPAFAGVILAHAITYALVAGPHGTRSLLERTGHGYWALAVAVAFVVAGAAGVRVIARRFHDRWDSGISAEPALSMFARLALIQTAMFAAIEVGERSAAGVPLATLTQHKLLWIGLLLQVLVALATTISLRMMSRLAAVSAGDGRAFARPASSFEKLFVGPARPALMRLLDGGHGVRAPPVLS